jgi:hypothetical protein
MAAELRLNESVAAPERTLAIIFGASRWPHAARFDSAEAFAGSAYEFARYLTDADGFAMPVGNLLNLFDHEVSQVDLRQIMRKYIAGRRKVLEDKGQKPSDVILYFAGHAGFGATPDAELYFTVRSTSDDDPFESSIKASALSRMLGEECAGLRAHVLLDCCFPGTAAQQDARHVRAQFPGEDTALLWAVSASAPTGAPLTTFTGALIELLRGGDPACPDRQFSLQTLRGSVESRISGAVADQAARPSLHCPDPSQGPRVPLFNNPAHKPG